MKLSAINPNHGLPTIEAPYVGIIPDALAWKTEATNVALQNKDYWPRVARRIGLDRRNTVILSYYAELAKDPTLAIEPTPDAIATARNSGLRWERIGIFAGLAPNGQVTKGANAARDLYAQATGNLPETSYATRGRRFAEMIDGPAKPTPAVTQKLSTIKQVRKQGVRGDKRVHATAVEIIAEEREAKRTKKEAK